MQTSGGNMMGGAPHHISSNTPGVIAPSVGADGLLKFDEIVLESNEIEKKFRRKIWTGLEHVLHDLTQLCADKSRFN